MPKAGRGFAHLAPNERAEVEVQGAHLNVTTRPKGSTRQSFSASGSRRGSTQLVPDECEEVELQGAHLNVTTRPKGSTRQSFSASGSLHGVGTPPTSERLHPARSKLAANSGGQHQHSKSQEEAHPDYKGVCVPMMAAACFVTGFALVLHVDGEPIPLAGGLHVTRLQPPSLLVSSSQALSSSPPLPPPLLPVSLPVPPPLLPSPPSLVSEASSTPTSPAAHRPGYKPAKGCETQLNEWCRSPAGGSCPFRDSVARIDGPFPVAWRCYSPSTLSADGLVYLAGDSYCSRDHQLTAVLGSCLSENFRM